MKIAIFGATGASGQLVVRKALDAGHSVTAFARKPEKLSFKSNHLRIVQGNLADAQAIDDAVVGADAVISLLGPTGKQVGTPVADGMRLIVAAMQRHGVRRLIATATPSAEDLSDGFSLSFQFAVKMMKALAGSAYAEIVHTADAVRGSGLDWTLVRLPILSSKPAARSAVTGYVGDPGIKLFSLSRSALADFLLLQLQDRAWLRKAPVLCNG